MSIFLICLLIMNASGFLVMTADKLFAKSGCRRVSERNLLGIAAMGGSLGIWIAMYTVRHKTKHRKFTVGIPVILALQIILAACFFLR